MTLFQQMSRVVILLIIAALFLSACRQNGPGNDAATNEQEATGDTDDRDSTVSPENGEDEEGEPTRSTEATNPAENSSDEGDVTPSPAAGENDEEAEQEPTPVLELPETDPDVLNERMLFVPGGTFPMGGVAEEMLNECRQFRTGCLEDWFLASAPEHVVSLDPFYIDPYETTTGEYLGFLSFLGTHQGVCFGNDCLDPNFSRINIAESGEYTSTVQATVFPVLGVTWFGAAAYCQWRGVRLPTEAEWEMAASWDPETETKTRYPWGDVFDGDVVSFCDTRCQADQANTAFDDGWIIEAPAGSFEDGRSPIGAYDMAGNLWEWVSDWYSPTYFAESPRENPRGPTEGQSRVVKGGSWFDTGNFTSAQIRFPIRPEGGSITIGFRCAADG